MGIFFDNKPPHINSEEFKKIRAKLANRGLSEREVDMVESFFSSQMHEEREIDKGISEEELIQGIATLRDNEKVYRLNEKKLAVIEEIFRRYL